MRLTYYLEIRVEKFTFHESTVVDLKSTENNFELELEDVSFNGQSVKVKIEVEGVSKLLVDSQISDVATMLMPDGEILSLTYDDSSLDVLVEWNNFSSGCSATHGYSVWGDKVRAVVT